MQGFGGLTQGFMPVASRVAQNVDTSAQLSFLNNVLDQYVKVSGDALRSGGAPVSLGDFWYTQNQTQGSPANLFGTGGRAIQFGPFGQNDRGQTQGTGPGLMNDYASFQDFANAVASDRTGLARAFGLGAGLISPIGSLLFGAARAFGQDQTPQSFDITSAFSGGAGSSVPDFAAGTAFAGSPELGGQSGIGLSDQGNLGGFAGSPELGGRSDPSQGGDSGGGVGGGGGAEGPGGSSEPGGNWRRGGLIPSDSDDIMEARRAMVHEGEFVFKPEAVKKYGPRLLRAMNAGRLTKSQARELLRRAG